jgi:hypothetical protein
MRNNEVLRLLDFGAFPMLADQTSMVEAAALVAGLVVYDVVIRRWFLEIEDSMSPRKVGQMVSPHGDAPREASGPVPDVSLNRGAGFAYFFARYFCRSNRSFVRVAGRIVFGCVMIADARA